MAEQERLAPIDDLSLRRGVSGVFQFRGQDIGLLDEKPLKGGETIEV